MKARDSIITGPQGFVNLAGLAVKDCKRNFCAGNPYRGKYCCQILGARYSTVHKMLCDRRAGSSLSVPCACGLSEKQGFSFVHLL